MKVLSMMAKKGDYLVGALFVFVVVGLVYQGLYTLPRNYTSMSTKQGLFNS